MSGTHSYNLRSRRNRSRSSTGHFASLLDEVASDNENGGIEMPIKMETEEIQEPADPNLLALVAVTFLSFVTRFASLGRPPYPVWDESHFAKFASFYVDRKFFLDVHPPLGKMILGITAILAGQPQGLNYTFKGDTDYPSEVPYKTLRMVTAFFGTIVAPVTYLIAKRLGAPVSVALFAGLAVVFDNLSLVLSRFVLLDSFLQGFAVSAVCAYVYARRESSERMRNKFRTLTGIALGCMVSTKWIGLFTMATLGLADVASIWETIGSKLSEDAKLDMLKRKTYQCVKTFVLIPFVIYLLSFASHFAILDRSGSGDASMSSDFQVLLKGSSLANGPSVVAFESIVTLRFAGLHGGQILHSHRDRYPEGSKQQQVTTYSHRDANNWFVVSSPRNISQNDQNDGGGSLPSIVYVKHLDAIRLVHNLTRANLHTHSTPAPLSTFDQEVSGYGKNEIGDDNDDWIVSIPDAVSDDDLLYRIETKFNLIHSKSGCYLTSTQKILPDWAHHQGEVSCVEEHRVTNPYHHVWNIEEHRNAKLVSVKYQPPNGLLNRIKRFVRAFVDLNVAMWKSNASLVPKIGKRDLLVSSPTQWPFLKASIRMCNWADDRIKFVMLGNPLLWIAGSTAIMFSAYLLFKQTVVNHWKGQVSGDSEGSGESDYLLRLALLGWGAHYVPFFLMGRVTYLHHYLISEWFAILALTVCIWRAPKQFYSLLVPTPVWSAIALIIIGSSFAYFAPLSYGFVGASVEMSGRQWSRFWKITLT